MKNSELLKLRAEIDDDPLSRGYAAMTNVEIATSLRVKNVETIADAIDRTHFARDVDRLELAALTQTEQDRVWDILALPEIVPVGIVNDAMRDMFDAASTTREAWLERRTVMIARHVDIGIERPRAGDVADAKALVI